MSLDCISEPTTGDIEGYVDKLNKFVPRWYVKHDCPKKWNDETIENCWQDFVDEYFDLGHTDTIREAFEMKRFEFYGPTKPTKGVTRHVEYEPKYTEWSRYEESDIKYISCTVENLNPTLVTDIENIIKLTKRKPVPKIDSSSGEYDILASELDEDLLSSDEMSSQHVHRSKKTPPKDENKDEEKLLFTPDDVIYIAYFPPKSYNNHKSTLRIIWKNIHILRHDNEKWIVTTCKRQFHKIH